MRTPKICWHSFSECSLNPVYLNCTVYAKGSFVSRVWACLGAAPEGWQLFGSILEARSALARRGLIRVPRAEGDEPALVETWL